jgi:hypothetical protein
MRPSSAALSRLHRKTLYCVFAVLFLSGIAWYVLHDGLAWLGFDNGDTRDPFETFLLKLHGAAAMAALVVLGSLVPQHVKWAWQNRENRRTGVLMLSTQALLVVTGYALYYSGDEDVRVLASELHLIIGVGFPLILAWHIVEGRRRRASLREKAAQGFRRHGAATLEGTVVWESDVSTSTPNPQPAAGAVRRSADGGA